MFLEVIIFNSRIEAKSNLNALRVWISLIFAHNFIPPLSLNIHVYVSLVAKDKLKRKGFFFLQIMSFA
jgi:hypothetical protein